MVGTLLGGLVAVGPMVPTPPAAAEGGDDLVELCEPLTAVPEAGPRGCKSVEAGTWVAAQACRRIDGLQEPVCPTVDGRPVHEPAMAAFEASWLARALELQRRLDLDVPLTEALLPHTHNSANSSAYAPSLSRLDANQVLTLTDQLRLGMRAIEIDLHWTPHPSGAPEHGFRRAVQCHGQAVDTPVGAVHAGCSVDTPLADLLHEVRAWLDQPANADEVLLLYLENALDDDPAAHADAVAALESTLGDLVAKPDPGGGCQSLPVQRSKRDLLDAGTRVLITGNCGPGGWNDWVFDRYPAWHERGGSTFDCATERAELDFESVLVRRYEDSTWLSAMAGSGSHVEPETMAEMVRCGVNLVGFDQLHAGDDRLPSLVWSWRVDEPAADATGACAALGEDGRFFAADCATPRPIACRTAAGGWVVTSAAAPWASGDTTCQTAGHAGAGVPASGWDSGLLRAAADAAGAPDVWLAYGQDGTGAWVTGIPAADPGPDPEPEPDTPGRSGDRPADPRGHGGRPSQPGGPTEVGGGTPIATSRGLPDAPPLAAALLLATLFAAARSQLHRKRHIPR